MRVLCVGRHAYLSEHLGRFFEELGLECFPCVGFAEAAGLVAAHDPDAVICDYDLLATMALTDWETDPALSRLPVVAVSMTRHPGEAHLMDVNGIAGFLYLPTLKPADALRLLSAIRPHGARINPPNVLQWPATQATVQLR